ncbi:hypothetical protein U91I_01009 [alpha proteobacterium U9-1i]|nr:hypothetical protein U91I_01009 [alpha proteobacterium U9-1i]
MNLRGRLREARQLMHAAFLFYGRCLVRAVSGKLGRAATVTSAVSLAGLLLVAFLNRGAAFERLVTTSIPAVLFVVLLLLSIGISLVLAPVQLQLEEVRKREAIEALRKPKFAVSLPAGGATHLPFRGSTTETRGGERQTVMAPGETNVLCFICENIGEVAIRNARARVLAASRQDETNAATPLDIIEPIELTWKKDDLKSAFSKDLAPGEKCRVWLGGVRAQGQFWIYRDVNDLPVEYQQVFGRAGEFHVLIQVDADGAPPLQFVLRVRAAAGEAPNTSGIMRGRAEIALLTQASPRVAWPI